MKKLLRMITVMVAAAVMMTALCVCASAADTGNLLTNGKASNGLKGWKNPDAVWMTASSYDNHVYAYDGDFFFPKGFKGKDGSKTRIYQDVSVKKYIGMKATLSAYNRTWDEGHRDDSILMLQFLDKNGKVISENSVKGQKTIKWHKISVSNTVPDNAVTARVSLWSVYYQGSETDSYFDNVSLTMSGKAKDPNGTLSSLRIKLYKGSTVDLEGVLSDSTVGNDVTWSSSDTSVANVSTGGRVTGKAKGTSTITAKYGNKSVSIVVRVA